MNRRPSDEVKRLFSRILNVYGMETKYVSGQCANLAFATFRVLTKAGKAPVVCLDAQALHAWVECDGLKLDADYHGFFDEPAKFFLDEDDVSRFLKTPAEFVGKFGIRLTPRRVKELDGELTAWRNQEKEKER